MNPREILRSARESSGLSVHDAAMQTEVSEACYWDLEAHDDELTTCFSLVEVFRICEVLGIHPLKLFGEIESQIIATTPQEIAKKITAHCESTGLTISQFEDLTGWEVKSVVEHPHTLLSVWNLECLRDVCSHIGLGWLETLSGLFQIRVRAIT